MSTKKTDPPQHRQPNEPLSASTSQEACLAMVNRLVAAARSSQNAADMFDEAVGSLLGTNRTDGRCLDLIQRFGRLTAGQLAAQSGLTGSAVTTVIDRLERDGFAKRVRDQDDRRRIYVELTDFSLAVADQLYAPMGRAYQGALQSVSLKDMQIIAEYLEFSERVHRRHTQLLADQTPDRQKSPENSLQRAKAFALKSENICQELIDSWREVPINPPVSGKVLKG